MANVCIFFVLNIVGGVNYLTSVYLDAESQVPIEMINRLEHGLTSF